MRQPTEWSTAVAQQLLARYGVLTREVAGAEGIYGGFSAVYDVLKALEDAGRARRGYFVSGVGATQFALPAALELMRSMREMPDEPEVLLLSATDPANPYGTMLKWPTFAHGIGRATGGKPDAPKATAGESEAANAGRNPTRTAGAQVIFVNGTLAAYLSKGSRQLLVYLPDEEPQRTAIGRPLAARLAALAREAGLLIAEINGLPAADHPLAPYLTPAGFVPSAMGFMVRREPVGRPGSGPATPQPAQPEAKAGA